MDRVDIVVVFVDNDDGDGNAFIYLVCSTFVVLYTVVNQWPKSKTIYLFVMEMVK